MAKTKIVLCLSFFILATKWDFLSPSLAQTPQFLEQERWEKLAKQIERLSRQAPGKLGVYVKDLSNGKTVKVNCGRSWYLASGIKFPVALALLRQVEEGKVRLQERVELTLADYVDGPGPTNYLRPGSRPTLNYLLKQMIIHSDNTATDLIIKRIGIDSINQIRSLIGEQGLGPITTLLEVRKAAYAEVHPKARELSNQELIILKNVRGKKKRYRYLLDLLKLGQKPAQVQNLTQAFERFYQTGVNSGQLEVYGTLLEKFIQGELLNQTHTKLLKGLMGQIKTGKNRLQKGLSKKYDFIHKTGTQEARACDLGVVLHRKGKGKGNKKVVLVSCVERFTSLKKAEKVMARVGKLIVSSGIL